MEVKDSAGNTINTTAITYDAAGQILTRAVNGQTTSCAYNVDGKFALPTSNPAQMLVLTPSMPASSCFYGSQMYMK